MSHGARAELNSVCVPTYSKHPHIGELLTADCLLQLYADFDRLFLVVQ